MEFQIPRAIVGTDRQQNGEAYGDDATTLVVPSSLAEGTPDCV